MNQPIKFGTDGWRAIVAKDFTFDNLDRVARATARWLRKTAGEASTVVIGYDARFMGLEFAQYAARVLASEGSRLLFAEGVTPTPAISWATKAHDADAGIVITASHNPPAYNGFKIKASFGGPATPEMVAAVEAEVRPFDETAAAALPSFDVLQAQGRIAGYDIRAAYLNVLRSRLDVGAIIGSGLRIAHDVMYGAGRGAVSALLGRDRVVALHDEFNPGFDGQAPEPIERNLGALAETVVREGCAAGLANDGDADRIGMFDENGVFVTSHQMLALLVQYLHLERGLRGAIVKTFSTTHMLDKMGAAYGLPVETLPIGFKYIAPRIVEGDVLVGGEESGGIAVKGHLPERDGIYIGLLIVEMMVKRGKNLSELVQGLFDEFGPHQYHRVDVHTTEAKKAQILHRLEHEGGLEQIAGHPVERLETLDGYKHRTPGGWLLVRPSGTEPVLRIYAEAESTEAAKRLVEDATEQLGVA